MRFNNQSFHVHVTSRRPSRMRMHTRTSLRVSRNLIYSLVLDVLGIRNRSLAWEWVATEVKNHVSDSNRIHAESVDSAADIFTNKFASIRNCCFPLYINGSMAPEPFES